MPRPRLAGKGAARSSDWRERECDSAPPAGAGKAPAACRRLLARPAGGSAAAAAAAGETAAHAAAPGRIGAALRGRLALGECVRTPREGKRRNYGGQRGQDGLPEGRALPL